MSDLVLYFNKRVSSEAFEGATQAFLAAGYSFSSAPARNRDGCTARLKKEEEISVEWLDTDSLAISAVSAPTERLRADVARILSGVTLKEVRVI